MALKPLTELENLELVNSEQDCRGWPVVDATGQQLGTVREMLVDTDAERVAALVLDSGAQIPARSVSLAEGKVVLPATQADDASDRALRASDQDRAVLTVIEEEIRVGRRAI